MTTLTEFKEIAAKATKGPLEIVEHNWAETSICDAYGRQICSLNINDFGDVTEDNQDFLEDVVRAHADKIAISYAAFPALIAVAEEMVWALKNSRFILIAEGIDDTGVVNEALAAYEAWKGKIEGENHDQK